MNTLANKSGTSALTRDNDLESRSTIFGASNAPEPTECTWSLSGSDDESLSSDTNSINDNTDLPPSTVVFSPKPPGDDRIFPENSQREDHGHRQTEAAPGFRSVTVRPPTLIPMDLAWPPVPLPEKKKAPLTPGGSFSSPQSRNRRSSSRRSASSPHIDHRRTSRSQRNSASHALPQFKDQAKETRRTRPPASVVASEIGTEDSNQTSAEASVVDARSSGGTNLLGRGRLPSYKDQVLHAGSASDEAYAAAGGGEGSDPPPQRPPSSKEAFAAGGEGSDPHPDQVAPPVRGQTSAEAAVVLRDKFDRARFPDYKDQVTNSARQQTPSAEAQAELAAHASVVGEDFSEDPQQLPTYKEQATRSARQRFDEQQAALSDEKDDGKDAAAAAAAAASANPAVNEHRPVLEGVLPDYKDQMRLAPIEQVTTVESTPNNSGNGGIVEAQGVLVEEIFEDTEVFVPPEQSIEEPPPPKSKRWWRRLPVPFTMKPRSWSSPSYVDNKSQNRKAPPPAGGARSSNSVEAEAKFRDRSRRSVCGSQRPVSSNAGQHRPSTQASGIDLNSSPSNDQRYKDQVKDSSNEMDVANFADFSTFQHNDAFEANSPTFTAPPDSSIENGVANFADFSTFLPDDAFSPPATESSTSRRLVASPSSSVDNETSLSELLAHAKSKNTSSATGAKKTSSVKSPPAITAAYLRQHHNSQSRNRGGTSGGGGGGGGATVGTAAVTEDRASSVGGHSRVSRSSSGTVGSTTRRTTAAPHSHVTVAAPPGKLGIILANKADFKGTVVSGVRASSALAGEITPGDCIVAINGEDVSLLTVSEITTIMARKSDFARTLTILTAPHHTDPSVTSLIGQQRPKYATPIDTTPKLYFPVSNASAGSDGNMTGVPKTCYNCGGTGHVSCDCTSERLEGEERTAINKARAHCRRCFKCGKMGHISADCKTASEMACRGREGHSTVCVGSDDNMTDGESS